MGLEDALEELLLDMVNAVGSTIIGDVDSHPSVSEQVTLNA